MFDIAMDAIIKVGACASIIFGASTMMYLSSWMWQKMLGKDKK